MPLTSETYLALKVKCDVCRAKKGEYCEDYGVPDEAKPGVHSERIDKAKNVVSNFSGANFSQPRRTR